MNLRAKSNGKDKAPGTMHACLVLFTRGKKTILFARRKKKSNATTALPVVFCGSKENDLSGRQKWMNRDTSGTVRVVLLAAKLN